MKVYVVTKGTYSDYHIITATTDETLANQIAKKFSDKWEEATVEVYDDAKCYLKQAWFIRFDTKGNVKELCADDSEYSYHQFNIVQLDIHNCVYVTVQADDEVSAIKIAAEKRAEFLGKKAGII